MHDQAYMFIDKGYQDYYARFKKKILNENYRREEGDRMNTYLIMKRVNQFYLWD